MLQENKNTAIQVDKTHYKKRSYNSIERYISYFYQVDTIMQLPDCMSVLEIGMGSGLVANELRQLGVEVTTCDFDSSLNPNIVADVRNLPIQMNSYDCVMACQVLEHVSYSEFEDVLCSFSKITKKYVVISVPERHTGFNMVLKFPGIQTLFKRKFFDWSLRFPVRFPGFAESGQHYWEIDGHTTTTAKVRASIKKYFSIRKEFNPPLNKYHHFFVLEKK